ncbi:MAG: endonuclease III domain-containing protein [Pseudothermotoga sp.]
MQTLELLLKVYQILYESYGPQDWWPAESWFEVIVGAVLTQNTSWKNVERAIVNLKSNGLLEPQRFCAISVQELATFIKSAGFYNLKAQRLKNIVNLLNEYDFDFQRLSNELTREKLLSVKGIGKETCDSILLYAFNKPIFVVDNYTKRIFSRLHIIQQKDNYDAVQKLFELIPKDTKIYQEYHALIVKHAKDFCTKKKPKCNFCVIRNLCKYSE